MGGDFTLRLLLIAVILNKGSAGDSPLANSTGHDLLARNKRTLIYNINGGVAKFVMSVLCPVDLPKWQSLNWAINLQAQYLAPDKSFYNPWNLTRRRRSTWSDDSAVVEEDYSRQFIYHIIETVMNRSRINGRACLQRAICEVAQHPLSGNGHGFLGDILDAILIPPKGSTGVAGDDVYYAAHLAGVSGVDCLRQFPLCPARHGLLERVSVLM